MDTPQVDDFLMWLGGVAAAVLAIAATMVLIKKWLLSDLHSDLEDMRSQLYKNHGSSLRDAVDRIEEKQSEAAATIARVTERLDDHIVFHLEDK